MAEMNLLKANFTGRLGATYGYERKGASVISAVPFSHAPHNREQKSAFRAFAVAQGFYGSLSRDFKKYLGFSYKNKNPLNVIAHEYKVICENKSFSLKRIEDIIKPDSHFVVSVIRSPLNSFNVDIVLKDETSERFFDGAKIFVYVCNGVGQERSSGVVTMDSAEIAFSIPTAFQGEFQAVVIVSRETIKGWKTHASYYVGDSEDVINGVWYLDRAASKGVARIVPPILYLDSPNFRVENSTAIIDY